ncbi:hypothetical protein GCM10028807_09040 [Spirosoma daeguense]
MLSDFALHYQTTILPARSGKPRDKALVEGTVNILYNRVYAPLRNRVFHRLDELNAAILERVDAHNQMLFSGKEYSWRTRFEVYEQGASQATTHQYLSDQTPFGGSCAEKLSRTALGR